MTIAETTAHALMWWIAASTVVTSAAVIFAALAWWKAGRFMRQCRCVVTAYEPLVRQHEDTAERILPLLADRAAEHTQPIPTVVDEPVEEGSTGRHALADSTAMLPAAGRLLEDQPPAYYFAAQAGGIQ